MSNNRTTNSKAHSFFNRYIIGIVCIKSYIFPDKSILIIYNIYPPHICTKMVAISVKA